MTQDEIDDALQAIAYAVHSNLACLIEVLLATGGARIEVDVTDEDDAVVVIDTGTGGPMLHVWGDSDVAFEDGWEDRLLAAAGSEGL